MRSLSVGTPVCTPTPRQGNIYRREPGQGGQVRETCRILLDNRDGVKREYVSWLIGGDLDSFWAPQKKKKVVVGPAGGGRG